MGDQRDLIAAILFGEAVKSATRRNDERPLAARVVETTSRIRLAFAAACPEANLFRSLPGALLPLGP
jgi:hypothetical protein